MRDARATASESVPKLGDVTRRRAARHARPSRRWTLPSLVAAGLATAAGLGAWCCRAPGAGYDACHHLADRLGDAVAVSDDPRPLQVAQVEIGFDQRFAVIQHPPSAYRFEDVPAGRGSRLSAAPGLLPTAWGNGSDGVGFELLCSGPSGEWVQLLDFELTAESEAPRPAWHPQELSLGRCSSPRTSIELRTTCGPGTNCQADWAAWGDPRVVQPARFEPRLGRLAVLVSIDTLRPDRLSLYGAERPTSPRLERLAADGIVFETAVAPAPWTIPSHASMLSSTHPAVHGAIVQREISPEVPMLAEVLREAGWTTAGFVDTPWLGKFGFDRGYDHYDAKGIRGVSRRGVAITRQRLVDWLGTAAGDVFLFWHIMDVHGAYGAPAPFGGRFRSGLEIEPDGRLEELKTLAYHDYLHLERFRSLDDVIASYDEGIAAVDAELGRFLELLEAAGLYDDALIIVTSDHGESFMDHGIWVGHGLFLTDDEIRVPLVIKLPGNRFAGTRVGPMVRLLDVAPTVLDVLGVPAPPSFEGRSVVSPEPGSPRSLPRLAFGMSSNLGSRYLRTNRDKLITGWEKPLENVIRVHLQPRGPSPILGRLDDGERLFDLRSDPGETVDLAADDGSAQRADDLRRLARRHAERTRRIVERLGSTAGDPGLSGEDIQRLKALGYLDGNPR